MSENFHQRITKTLVDRLLEGETIRDTEIKGFGVRRQLGTPSYYLHKRVKGRLRWITIGPHGSPWTPETTRREAHRLLGQIVQGRDPQTERQLDRAKPTVQQAVLMFMDQHGPKLKPLTRRNYQRMLEGHVIPALGTRRLEEIMRVDVSRLHAAMKDKTAAANATLAILSKFMS